MEKSILRTVFCYLAVQLACLVWLGIAGSVPALSVLSYAASSVLLHYGLWLFLMRFRSDFFNQSTNKPLERINTANRITLLRISSLPTIAFLLGHKDIIEMKILLPILLALVFLTDSFDGQIARRRKQITRMGGMLDSISDYILIGVISIVYFRHDIVPKWFFLLIICRLLVQGIGMLLFILMKQPVPIKSTWGGKITIATTMTLYVAELVRMYLPASSAPAFRIAEYLAGALILILSFEKATIFFRHGKDVKAARSAQPDA